MNILRQFIMTAILSIAAGMLVGLPLILHENAPVPVNLIKSGLAGLVIGITAFLAVSLIYRTIRSHTFLAFCTVVIIIAFGTVIGGHLSGLEKIRQYIAVVAGAEAAGVILTYLLYRYSIKLNNKLKSAKEKYRIH